MRNSTKKVLFTIALAIIILLFARYIYSHWQDFAKLRIVDPFLIVIIIILTLLFSFTYGIVIKYILKAFKKRLKFNEWFGLSIITGFYNIIAPITGGLVPRAMYLKKKHHFSYHLFLSSLSGIYVTHFFAGSILGLLSIILIYQKYKKFNLLIVIVFLAMLITTSALILFSPRIKRTKFNILNHLISVTNGWHLISKNKKAIAIASSMAALQTIINMVGILLAFNIFGIHITFVQAFFLSCTGFLGGFVVTTPGIIGISEMIAVYSSAAIGIPIVQALAVALISRIISTATILTIGPAYSYHLIKEYNFKNLKRNI
jgi:uncharacterized protein (TIRG00374 family)